MILSDLSIRRPVLATVMSLGLVLVGLMAFQRLPVREYPNIDAPVVSVRSVYTGASAAVIWVHTALYRKKGGVSSHQILYLQTWQNGQAFSR